MSKKFLFTMLAISTAAFLSLALTPEDKPLTPCATEDQMTACYWDASERGNGIGTDFIVTESGEVRYTSF